MKDKSNFLVNLKEIIFSLLIAVIFSLIAILIFGLVMKFCAPSDTVVTVINEIIKIVSILVGVCMMCRNPRQIFIKGAAVGILYYFIVFLIAGGVNGSMTFKLINLLELVITAFSGIIANIINCSARLKKANS